MKIRKGDMVKIIAGKENGKTGRVLRVDQEKGRVWVEKLNMVKRHQRPTQLHKQGGIIDKEAPLNVSNVMYYDEKLGKGTRLGFKIQDGQKVRYSKKTGEILTSPK